MRLTALTPMLGVADIELSITFYRDVLGFAVSDQFTPEGRTKPTWVRLLHGKVEIMLSGNAGAGTSDEAVAAHADAHLYIMTDDVLAVRDRAVSMGFSVEGPTVRFYQIKEIEITDPDGYTLVFGQVTDERPTAE